MKKWIRELTRTYEVLGPELGEIQNYTDIKQWKKEGYLTNKEAETLDYINFKMRVMLREEK